MSTERIVELAIEARKHVAIIDKRRAYSPEKFYEAIDALMRAVDEHLAETGANE